MIRNINEFVIRLRRMTTLRRIGALLGIMAILAVSPIATADPNDGDPPQPAPADGPPAPPAPPPGSTTVSLDDLGSSSTIWFDARRNTTSSSFTFIVPKGMTPVSLNTTAEIPVNLQFGVIAATQDSRTISRTPMPLKDQSPVVIPLTGMKVAGDWVSLTVTVTAIPVDDTYCWDPMAPFRLVNSSITFAGNEVAPSNVASFLPPTLRKLTIAVPSKPSQAESEAAVQLAGAMATRYGWMNTDIGVAPLGDGATTLPGFGPGERQIVVKEGPEKEKGLFLQQTDRLPALLITGPGEELTNQTRMLTDVSLPFALSNKAVAGPLATEQRPVPDNTTFAEMKLNGLNAEALRPEVNIKIDQTLFAQPINDLRVHLIGSHTPLANLNGEVTISAGDTMIDRWPVNAEGTIDHWVTIPNRSLRRTTNLKVRMHTTGDPGHCNDYLNPVLRIDGDSEVQVVRASPPAPPGFLSLPQTLLPRVQIGFGTAANPLIDTIRAAQIVVGLQRNSSIPLLVSVTSLQDAISSKNPAILISADGWTDKSLTLPFSSDLGRITIGTLDAGGTFTNITLDPAIKWASLQTLFDGNRTLLIATSNGAAAQLDELLRWLNERPSRWGELDGRATISVPGNLPVTVPSRRSDLPPDENDSDSSGLEKWVWRAAGAVAAIALAGAFWIAWRTYQNRESDTVAAAIAGAGTGIDDPSAEGPDAPQTDRN